MKTRDKKRLVGGLILFSVTVVLAFFFFKYKMNEGYEKAQTYSFQGIDSSICGIVSSIEDSRGYSRIILQNRKKICIRPSISNEIKERYLSDYLQSGDSLFKRKGSDTLKIFRDRDSVFFIIH